LKNPTRGDEGKEIRQSNLSYLRQTLAEVGWIDSDRFGQRTSVYTVLLAKHTEDLRLMLTILPYASTELKKSKKGQTYAILYDAVQLELGRKQLYGTQVTADEKGPFVLPLEDPKNVDSTWPTWGFRRSRTTWPKSGCTSTTDSRFGSPSASFTVNCSGRICVFDGSGSSDDVGIVDWEWNLGDGVTAGGGSSVAHLYAAAGTYVVTLAVTDTSGQITSLATLVHVSG